MAHGARLQLLGLTQLVGVTTAGSHRPARAVLAGGGSVSGQGSGGGPGSGQVQSTS